METVDSYMHQLSVGSWFSALVSIYTIVYGSCLMGTLRYTMEICTYKYKYYVYITHNYQINQGQCSLL